VLQEDLLIKKPIIRQSSIVFFVFIVIQML